MDNTNNLTYEVLVNELGYNSHSDINISSPFRRDSDPSFRAYVLEDGGFYDYGTGKSYSPVNLIMELHQISYYDAVDYINIHYGVNVNNQTKQINSDLSSKLLNILHFIGVGSNTSELVNLERGIKAYSVGDKIRINAIMMSKKHYNI